MTRSDNERNRLSRVVTRTGDRGETGLADGRRLAKDTATIELLGELDELNARLGSLSVSLTDEPDELGFVREQQQAVFDLGGFVAMGEMAAASQLPSLERLDAWIEAGNRDLPPLKEFILPGGTEAMARAHLVRTATRRAERLAWSWCQESEQEGNQDDDQADDRRSLAAYLNRLSDAWFVFARRLDRDGQYTVYWRGTDASG